MQERVRLAGGSGGRGQNEGLRFEIDARIGDAPVADIGEEVCVSTESAGSTNSASGWSSSTAAGVLAATC